MTVHKGSPATGHGVERHSGTNGVRVGAAVVLFLWVLLILAELGLFYAVHEETSKLIVRSRSSSSSSVTRKMRFLATELESTSLNSSLVFDASPSKVGGDSSLSSSMNNNNNNSSKGDPVDTVYEDDKRIIHTGPNPLHN